MSTPRATENNSMYHVTADFTTNIKAPLPVKERTTGPPTFIRNLALPVIHEDAVVVSLEYDNPAFSMEEGGGEVGDNHKMADRQCEETESNVQSSVPPVSTLDKRNVTVEENQANHVKGIRKSDESSPPHIHSLSSRTGNGTVERQPREDTVKVVPLEPSSNSLTGNGVEPRPPQAETDVSSAVLAASDVVSSTVLVSALTDGVETAHVETTAQNGVLPPKQPTTATEKLRTMLGQTKKHNSMADVAVELVGGPQRLDSLINMMHIQRFRNGHLRYSHPFGNSPSLLDQLFPIEDNPELSGKLYAGGVDLDDSETMFQPGSMAKFVIWVVFTVFMVGIAGAIIWGAESFGTVERSDSMNISSSL